MNMRRLLVVGALLWANVLGQGVSLAQNMDDRFGNMTASVFISPSHMINALDIYDRLLDSYNYTGVGAQVGFLTRGSGDWFDKAYNYPEFGFGVWWQPYGNALEFKNGSRLGNMLNLYGYGNWDIFKTRDFSFGPAARMGFSLTGCKYDPVTNPSNLYIGTNLEYLVSVGVEASLRLADDFSMGLSVMGSHHSNGKQGIPNFGLNELCLNLGAKYWFGTVVDRSGVDDEGDCGGRPSSYDKLTFSPYLATGFHSCERIWTARGKQGNAPLYQRIMTGLNVSYRYHPIFSSGVGVDVTYTTNVEDLRSCDMAKYPDEYMAHSYCPIYFGVAAFQSFHYKKVEAHLKFGRYVYKELGIIEDWGRNYQKVGFSYNFDNNLYLGFDMLTVNFDSSDCLEFSIGYRIPVRTSAR